MKVQFKLWLMVALHIGVLGYWLAMFMATHVSATVAKKGMVVNDKVIHGSTYFLLAMGCALLWQLQRPMTKGSYAAVCAGLLAYGGLDELTQPWVGRNAEWGDWLADAAGVMGGLVLFSLLSQVWTWRGRRKPPYRRGVIN